jgi:hypothetical protein
MTKSEIYKRANNGLQIDEGDDYLLLIDDLTSSEQRISNIQVENKLNSI